MASAAVSTGAQEAVKRSMNGQALAALFLLACLLFNYPLLSLFNASALALGVPVLYLYLFVAWAVVVVLMAYVAER